MCGTTGRAARATRVLIGRSCNNLAPGCGGGARKWGVSAPNFGRPAVPFIAFANAWMRRGQCCRDRACPSWSLAHGLSRYGSLDHIPVRKSGGRELVFHFPDQISDKPRLTPGCEPMRWRARPSFATPGWSKRYGEVMPWRKWCHCPGRRQARFGRGLTKTDERSAMPSTEKTRLASATSSYVILLTPSVATTRAQSEETLPARRCEGLGLVVATIAYAPGARRSRCRSPTQSGRQFVVAATQVPFDRIAFAPMREALLFYVALGHASARRVLHPSINQALCKAQARASLRALNNIADASADNASSKPHRVGHHDFCTKDLLVCASCHGADVCRSNWHVASR